MPDTILILKLNTHNICLITMKHVALKICKLLYTQIYIDNVGSLNYLQFLICVPHICINQ